MKQCFRAALMLGILLALLVANKGEVDGDLYRKRDIHKAYPSRIVIPVPVVSIEEMAFTKGKKFEVTASVRARLSVRGRSARILPLLVQQTRRASRIRVGGRQRDMTKIVSLSRRPR